MNVRNPLLARLRTARTGGLLALALVVALLPLGLSNAYLYDVAVLVGLNAIVCVGLNLLIGYAGQISLGHAGFFALGGCRSASRAAGRNSGASSRKSTPWDARAAAPGRMIPLPPPTSEAAVAV